MGERLDKYRVAVEGQVDKRNITIKEAAALGSLSLGCLIALVTLIFFIAGVSSDLKHVAEEQTRLAVELSALSASYGDRLQAVEVCCQLVSTTVTHHMEDHPDDALREQDQFILRAIRELSEEVSGEMQYLRERVDRLLEDHRSAN